MTPTMKSRTERQEYLRGLLVQHGVALCSFRGWAPDAEQQLVVVLRHPYATTYFPAVIVGFAHDNGQCVLSLLVDGHDWADGQRYGLDHEHLWHGPAPGDSDSCWFQVSREGGGAVH